MTIPEFISAQPAERQPILNNLHKAIMANDSTVTPVVEPMMGKEMIIYKERGCVMKYALTGAQKHMSLHCLPMYMNPALHSKYEALLPKAKFQKGCINFTGAEDLPVEVATGLITDCARISITDMLENRKKKK